LKNTPVPTPPTPITRWYGELESILSFCMADPF
jgi:hypothetical protein